MVPGTRGARRAALAWLNVYQGRANAFLTPLQPGYPLPRLGVVLSGWLVAVGRGWMRRGGGGTTGRDTYRGQREGEKRGGRSLHCNFCRGVTLTAVSRLNRNSDPVSFCSPPSVLFPLSARYRPPSALRPLRPPTATAQSDRHHHRLPPDSAGHSAVPPCTHTATDGTGLELN